MSNSVNAPQSAAAPDVAPDAERKSGTTPVPTDRRKRNIPVATDRRAANAAAKRKSSERRRLIDPTTCERDYSTDEVEFMNAMNDYKRRSGRMFPTCSEILEVIRNLGYSKPGQIPQSAEPFLMTAQVVRDEESCDVL